MSGHNPSSAKNVSRGITMSISPQEGHRCMKIVHLMYGKMYNKSYERGTMMVDFCNISTYGTTCKGRKTLI